MPRSPRSPRSAIASALFLATALLVGCSKSEENKASPTPAPKPTTAPAATATTADTTGSAGGGSAEAKTIFTTRCATCHGTDGKGKGPASITLNPKPRNYTDVAWQKSVTDDHIREIIVKGGAAVGKSPLMPPNPDLENKPAVVTSLVAMVRAFGGT
jgi:mono/diheme cytochrome c family protein